MCRTGAFASLTTGSVLPRWGVSLCRGHRVSYTPRLRSAAIPVLCSTTGTAARPRVRRQNLGPQLLGANPGGSPVQVDTAAPESPRVIDDQAAPPKEIRMRRCSLHRRLRTFVLVATAVLTMALVIPANASLMGDQITADAVWQNAPGGARVMLSGATAIADPVLVEFDVPIPGSAAASSRSISSPTTRLRSSSTPPTSAHGRSTSMS